MQPVARVGLLLLLGLGCCPSATAAVPKKSNELLDKYRDIQEDKMSQRDKMCSFLLSQTKAKGGQQLELEQVTQLFEVALEHLSKSVGYVTLMAPHMKPQAIEKFDANGGKLVLAISQARNKLIYEFEMATRQHASEERKQQLLESYFNMACDYKLNTIMAEKTMYGSALKIERDLRVELLPNSRPEKAAP